MLSPWAYSLPSVDVGTSAETEKMRAHYTRLFTDERGASRLADFDIELSIGFAVPPAEPLHFAQFLAPDSTFWIGAPTSWKMLWGSGGDIASIVVNVNRWSAPCIS